jgi:hypothetical protein
VIASDPALVDEDATNRPAVRPVAEAGQVVGVVARFDPALERRDRDFLTSPRVHRDELLRLTDVRPGHRKVSPVEHRKERLAIETLVVDSSEVPAALDQLLQDVAAGVGRGLDEAELRGGHEQIDRVVVLDRPAHEA